MKIIEIGLKSGSVIYRYNTKDKDRGPLIISANGDVWHYLNGHDCNYIYKKSAIEWIKVKKEEDNGRSEMQ